MLFDAEKPLPAARLTDLVTTETADSLLVYDEKDYALHTLNLVAATVWRLLDGERTASDVLVAARAELDETISMELIRLAIVIINEANLLVVPVETASATGGDSRRRLLKKAGLVSIPAIISITVPFAAAHASTDPPEVCEPGGPSGADWFPSGRCTPAGDICCDFGGIGNRLICTSGFTEYGIGCPTNPPPPEGCTNCPDGMIWSQEQGACLIPYNLCQLGT